MSQDSFALLAEPIRRVLWNMRWTELRPIQERAIPLVLNSEQDILITARTAAGKTEAAFLPILSRVCDNPVASVRAMYVGPLKALINDQFRRLEDLCRHADIPVHRWHGDVSGQQKKNLLAKPGGVLLITPESIESLFVNQTSALRPLFHSLSFVVIDELHAMIGSERGTHLRSLLFRLDRFSVTPYRIVALSATLGDLGLSANWMRPTMPESVSILEDTATDKAIRFKILGYRKPHPQNISPPQAHADPEDSSEAPPAEMTSRIYQSFRDTRNLIFANSRADVEWFGDQLNQHAAQDGIPGRFLVHHGSLSRVIREQTETLMQGSKPYTTVCSPTLELGIDIGNVSSVGQIGAPWSVASMVQRLGRSGREDGEAHSMRLYVLEDEPGPQSTLCDRLYPELLQSIALTELMLKKWVEPPSIARRDFSTLTQQILSVIAETGGLSTKDLFIRLCSQGAFRNVDTTTFASLLRSLGTHDLIEQMPTGDLILGLAGEEIVRHYDFYSAFATVPEYRMVYGTVELGTLPIRYLPNKGDHVLMAARRWQVLSLDDRRREISVTPAKGRKKPKYQGGGGFIHTRVRQVMREVLLNRQPIEYLNDAATRMLDEARQTALQCGLKRQAIVPIGASSSLLFTWTGSRSHHTLMLMAAGVGLECVDHNGLALEFALDPSNLAAEAGRLATSIPNSAQLASLMKPKQQRKYDEYVCEDLLEMSIADEFVDTEGAMDVLDTVCTCR